ncbi:spore germination protein [Lysinibacillus sp. SGAir0095]|uniref:spore germination protein n=1 Tax=Lysinibacillus sp. SGAir0095 TaxID=2070463 RepID=UPI0010CD4EBA|nr:spore germination protein [Lysinibacillus sp. SGAir0095]QCR33717.1 spore germination protein [Lysinibacillus sp. SGAir0095]
MNQLDLSSWFHNVSDIVQITKSQKGKYATHKLTFLYCSNLVDTNAINETILPKITEEIAMEQTFKSESLSGLLGVSELSKEENLKNEIEKRLFSGDLIIIDEQSTAVYSIPVTNAPKRSPEESNLETSVRGPRDGFVENISDNMALIRQRLKTSSLKSKEFTIGERSKTKIILLYMEDILNPTILDEVQNRLESINIDVLNSSYQLEEMLYDQKYSIFPLMDYIGRPDYVVDSLNQGRFAILVDGNPSCLIGPTSMVQLMLSPEDTNNSFFYISFVRLLRLIALVTTIFLPGFFVALITYQTEQIPYTWLATISMTRVGLPLSGAAEAFIMITLFELFKEAGLRLPKAVGQTVAVLGGLIIGDAAIRAGLTSPAMLVVISITVISGYTLINQNIGGNVLLLRYFVLIFCSSMGLYGFFLSFFLIITFLFALESFGQSYVSFFTNPKLVNIAKVMLKFPSTLLKKRNPAYHPKDKTRQKE